MASEKILEVKKQQMAELREKLLTMGSVILADYRGLTVAQDTAMRSEMRKANIEYKVIKNRLLKKAVEGTKYEDLMPHLEGPTSVAMSEDEISAAKIMSKYANMKEYGKFELKAGVIGDQIVDVNGIEAYAKIPGKNELIAMMLGGMKAPITSLALVLKAILEKKEEPAA
ncbi:MAG: 50S ribosomal protein L10 [Clostridia bacterium]|jgi:large subunit ribosomal protein L10|nr:50S ribosomal protein L10 [Clostridia bacterium]MDD3094131.1 50S ribosomal protein L10 [Clostridia bacterium]MDD3972747.1 50S ribosomal protein L10 [Clostridia bacterium]MDD4543740.1 50S ribosomal protein L10 [Clostridia bacterium]NLF36408.1 50S ribosomal protein L10 [Clostridiaceae bacterium]